jgi:hypothetical protein
MAFLADWYIVKKPSRANTKSMAFLAYWYIAIKNHTPYIYNGIFGSFGLLILIL